MYKIKIENSQFKCPMLNLIITERGDLNYSTCRICKNNVLSITDNKNGKIIKTRRL